MNKRVKWLFWMVALGALAAVSVYNATRPLQAELLTIKPRTIEEKFVENGLVKAAWEKDLFSAVAGSVKLLNAKEGEPVTAGEVLVRLDTRETEYQIAQLRGQLSSIRGQERQAFSSPRASQVAQQQLAVKLAEQQLNSARGEFVRTETLFTAGVVSRLALDEAARAVTQLELIHAQQVQALRLLEEDSGPPPGTGEQFAGLAASLRAQISMLEYQKSKAVLTSPANAVVSAVLVEEGAVVAPGVPLLSLFRPGEYELELYLLPEDIRHVTAGMPVTVTFDEEQAGEAFAGKVSGISPAAIEKLSAMGVQEERVKVTVALSGDITGVRPGFAMEATFVTQRLEGKLVVPKTALFKQDGEDAVWVLRSGRARVQPIKTGLETDDEAVVVSGLEMGDMVLQNPRLEGLKEGVRVVGQ